MIMASILFDLPVPMSHMEKQPSYTSINHTTNTNNSRSQYEYHYYSTDIGDSPTHLSINPPTFNTPVLPPLPLVPPPAASVDDYEIYNDTYSQFENFHLQHDQISVPLHTTTTTMPTTTADSTTSIATPKERISTISTSTSTSIKPYTTNTTTRGRPRKNTTTSTGSTTLSNPTSSTSSKHKRILSHTDTSGAVPSSSPKPYPNPQEYRKFRHRLTDTNRRIRIKTLLEQLRTILYTHENRRIEQSQVIQDSLEYIAKLRQENTILQQRVKQMEQLYEPALHTDRDGDAEADNVTIHDNENDIQVDTNSIDADIPSEALSTTSNTVASTDTVHPSMSSEVIKIHSIPESLRQTNIAIWTTSLDGRWLDMNMVFELTTSYKITDLQNRYVAGFPAFATSPLTEDDPYDSADNEGSHMLLSRVSREPTLGLGCPIHSDPVISKRAIEAPLLFNAYWLDAAQKRRSTKFMAQVIKDEQNMKPAYVLHMYYRCL